MSNQSRIYDKNLRSKVMTSQEAAALARRL
jgi:hypothetical protein